MGTSLIRNTPLLGRYSRTIPRVLWWSLWGGLFLMSKVPLCMELNIEWGEGIISVRCRAKMAHVRQSRPDSGLGFQVKICPLLDATKIMTLASGWGAARAGDARGTPIQSHILPVCEDEILESVPSLLESERH